MGGTGFRNAPLTARLCMALAANVNSARDAISDSNVLDIFSTLSHILP